MVHSRRGHYPSRDDSASVVAVVVVVKQEPLSVRTQWPSYRTDQAAAAAGQVVGLVVRAGWVSQRHVPLEMKRRQVALDWIGRGGGR